jgi:uncharacterized repeat protein (TIGR01451 family)
MMKLQNRTRTLVFGACCLLVLSGMAAFAQRQMARASATGRPEVKVLLSGAIERGGLMLPVEKASAVNPGEILHWTITSQNEGNAPAREYKAIGQIPRGTTLVAGSTTADGTATVVYSIDNGKTYSAAPVTEEKQADGSVKLVPAPVSMYTQVRYEWSDPLAGGGQLNASYKVRVK